MLDKQYRHLWNDDDGLTADEMLAAMRRAGWWSPMRSETFCANWDYMPEWCRRRLRPVLLAVLLAVRA